MGSTERSEKTTQQPKRRRDWSGSVKQTKKKNPHHQKNTKTHKNPQKQTNTKPKLAKACEGLSPIKGGHIGGKGNAGE